jgi:hypothetical protein
VRPLLNIEGETREADTKRTALNGGMVLALSQAMDSDEDVELTPEVLVQLAEEGEMGLVGKMPANISAMYKELPEPPTAAYSSPVTAPNYQLREIMLVIILILLLILMITILGVVFTTNFLV